MDYGFQLDPGEQIIRVVHRSFVDLVAPVIMFLVLIIVAAGLAFIEGRSPADIPFPTFVTLALIIVLTAVAAAILLIGIYTFRRNVLIFTNQHLVEVEQPTLFARQVSQLTYQRVQDVSGNRTGFWATILDYGNVQIQSAGEQEKFVFIRAPHPERLAEEALQIRDHCMHMMATSGASPAVVSDSDPDSEPTTP